MRNTRLDRRSFLSGSAIGLGGLAANALLGRIALGADGRASELHHGPTAKRVLLIFTLGGMSQLELFDDKPLLRQRHGDDLPASLFDKNEISTISGGQGALPTVGSVARFRRYGQCGMQLSEWIPELGRHADRITLIRTMQTDSVVHERARVSFFTGTTLLDRPSMGSWVSYGLGSENRDLPEFVVLTSGKDEPPHGRIWGSGFLPGHHQGVPFQGSGEPVLFSRNPPGVADESRAQVLRALRELNELEAQASGDPGVRTRIRAYEKAARMQLAIPELTDLADEPPEVLKRYGAQPDKPSFGRNCLLARRLLERDVRFVQLLDLGWDHHGDLPEELRAKCIETDAPVGALLDDLAQRGLLEDTLVVFAGEFGRTSYCDGALSGRSYGRDHNHRVGGMWMAGGGVRGGNEIGVTDEWGWDVAQDPVHVHDVQATVLHCLGIDHTRLVHRFQGRDFRLTDVGGRVLENALA